MNDIKDINDGLTCERVSGIRVVKYCGQECPLIKRVEILCEQDIYYNGYVLDTWETYRTPVGVVEWHYWASGAGAGIAGGGAGLERYDEDWRIVPVNEMAAVQKRFEARVRRWKW